MPFHLPGTTPRDGSPTIANRRWRIFWSYAPDWLLTIFAWGIFYLLDKVNGYRRLFSVTDTSLAHPYAVHERVPVWLLALVCGVIPGIMILLTGGLYRRSFWDAHAGILGFILSLGLSVTLTNIIKITVGRPRPDLFDRCQLPSTLTSDPIHGLTSWEACTRTDLLKDGFRSFPSGHSSFAWAGMWYLILYAAAKMRISNRKGYTWKSWLLLAPLACALLVTISRTMDYRHHATDVIAGGILGVLTAWYGYRQYYPPIDAPQSYKPYSPRIPKDTDHLPTHQRHSTDGEHTSFIPSGRQGLGDAYGTQANTIQAHKGLSPHGSMPDARIHAYPPDMAGKGPSLSQGGQYNGNSLVDTADGHGHGVERGNGNGIAGNGLTRVGLGAMGSEEAETIERDRT